MGPPAPNAQPGAYEHRPDGRPTYPHERPANASTSAWALRLVLGTAITAFAILSQYFVPELLPASWPVYHNLGGDLFIVYGVPILAFLFLLGLDPLRGFVGQMRVATFEGLGWYGGLSLLAVGITIVLAIVYSLLDPSALDLFSKQNPALSGAESNPWLYVALSFLVGVCEEVIFRGWIFGTWWRRTGAWFVPAIVTSAVFASVHLYYGLTYGAASPFYYTPLFLLGFAFAATYRASNGNLLVPSLLHGGNDALAFLTLVLSGTASLASHYLFVVGAAVVGFVYYLRGRSVPPPPAAPTAPPPVLPPPFA